MSFDEAHRRLSALPSIQVTRNEPLSRHTRFALGGPAAVFAVTSDEATFVESSRPPASLGSSSASAPT